MPEKSRVALYYLAIILLSFNFRTPLVAMGALMDVVKSAINTDATVMGIIGALPVLVSAATSPFAPKLARTFGLETMIIVGCLMTFVGGVVRAMLPNVLTIMAGTAILSCGIALNLVLILAVIRRDQPSRIERLTVTEMFSLAIMGAVTAGVTVPLQRVLGWQVALGVWSLLAVPPIALWFKIKNTTCDGIPKQVAKSDVNVLKSKLAWTISIYLGLQSLVFFSFMSWLPTMLVAKGYSLEGAGLCYTIFQFIGIPVLLLLDPITKLKIPMERLLSGASCLILLGVVGVICGPTQLSWLYSAAVGGGCASTVTLILMIVSQRGRHAGESAALSGMTQTIGFLVASIGPFVSGWLLDVTGSWDIPLGALAVISASLVVLGWFAGRPGEL